jgi:hypothetical protein
LFNGFGAKPIGANYFGVDLVTTPTIHGANMHYLGYIPLVLNIEVRF